MHPVIPLLCTALLAAQPTPKVDFERHVMGLFSRAGCNAGGCHGSFQGKNGFRLSLFGADPGKDHAVLTREAMGRRVDPLEPDSSLLMVKAIGGAAHGGGRRIVPGTWQHAMLREWIAGGARWTRGSGDVASLSLTPDEYALVRQGETVRVRAVARFADGTEEDVTRLCDFRTQDDGVAQAVEPGVVRASRPGDTALLVSYRGNVRALRVLVPAGTPAVARPPEHGPIDREVFAKLRLLGVEPAGLSTDAEFLRRASLDAIGALPTPDEARAFLADRSPDKRAKKIEALLAHPLHAALWATRYSDITGNNTFAMRAPTNPARIKYSQAWHDWFRVRFADNMPYDEIVRGVLTATSRDGRSRAEWLKEVEETEAAAARGFASPIPRKASLDLFWRVGVAPSLEDYAERTAAAFLGVRLECAQCHKHPFDRWTQSDYRSYANVFSHVFIGLGPDTPRTLNKAGLSKGAGIVNEVWIGGKGRRLAPADFVPVIKEIITAPDGKKQVVMTELPPVLPAKALGGPVLPLQKGKDARQALFDWMRSPDNPAFARAMANRVWAHYFGVGIVHPADDFSLANPPTNARLLDGLARDFAENGYDLRRLHRAILSSRAYQLSSAVNDSNKHDRNKYARAYARPLLAEVVLDVLGDATGLHDDFGPDAPPGTRATEVGSLRLLDADLAYALRAFGRPDRVLACDCERTVEPSLAQTLYRMADPALAHKLGTAIVRAKGKLAPRGEGRLKALLASGKDEAAILEELFLASLTRFPTKAEATHFAAWRKESGLKREEACADALWALLNTREFILNH